MSEESADTQSIFNIIGEKVALGPLRRDLVPTYTRWINDFSTLRTMGTVPHPITVEQETAWYDRASVPANDQVSFTIYERTTSQPIGNTGWHGIDYRNRTAWMGIFIGEPSARGKGYGTEAARLMLDFAFTALGLHSVMLTVYAYNMAGIRAYEKAGFKEFGRRRESKWLAGRWHDEVYMDCLASEFESPVLARVLAPDPPR